MLKIKNSSVKIPDENSSLKLTIPYCRGIIEVGKVRSSLN